MKFVVEAFDKENEFLDFEVVYQMTAKHNSPKS